MDFLKAPPQWILDRAGPLRGFLQGIGWQIVLALLVLLALFVLWKIVRSLFPGGQGTSGERLESALEEHVGEYPPPKPGTGDRQLRVEGVPVRLRLVAVAPAGKADEIDEDTLDELLEKVLPGLGEIFRADRPRVRIWPLQLSYEGFTKHFQRNTILPEEEGEPTPWVVLAGRAKLGKQQIMLGLALLASKPTTVGRRTIDAHEWASVLRVRVRD